MADERMSAHEVAVLTRDDGLGLLTKMERYLLAELRRERARADALEKMRDNAEFALQDAIERHDRQRAGCIAETKRADAAEDRLDAFARAVVLAATGIAQTHASLDFLLDGLPREVAGVRSERDQLRRDRERERDIAAMREREACVAYLRRCASDADDISYRLLADEIERGEHHG